MLGYLKKLNLLNEVFVILKEFKRNEEKNNSLKFHKKIDQMLKNKPIVTLDIGASGGFNTEEVFNKKYNKYFKVNAIEPIKKEFDKIKSSNKSNLGFWSEDKDLNLYITNDFGATSVFEPNLENFQFIYNDAQSLKNVEVKNIEKIKCTRIDNYCRALNIDNIDFIKIDTQGSEYDILSGLGKYRPLLIRAETQTISCYKNMSTFEKVIDLLDQFGYVALNFDQLDSSVLKMPIFVDIIFIPKFENYLNSVIIKNRKDKFVALLKIFSLQKYLHLYNL